MALLNDSGCLEPDREQGDNVKTPLGLDGKPLVLRQPRDETRDYARDVWLRIGYV